MLPLLPSDGTVRFSREYSTLENDFGDDLQREILDAAASQKTWKRIPDFWCLLWDRQWVPLSYFLRWRVNKCLLDGTKWCFHGRFVPPKSLWLQSCGSMKLRLWVLAVWLRDEDWLGWNLGRYSAADTTNSRGLQQVFCCNRFSWECLEWKLGVVCCCGRHQNKWILCKRHYVERPFGGGHRCVCHRQLSTWGLFAILSEMHLQDVETWWRGKENKTLRAIPTSSDRSRCWPLVHLPAWCKLWPWGVSESQAVSTPMVSKTQAESHGLSSTSVAEHQVKLIKQAGSKTISLIQLAKALKVRFMDPTRTYLPSYVLEVLALDYMQEMRIFDFDDGLQYIFSQLRDLETDFVFHLSGEAARAGIRSSDVESYWRGHKQWSAGWVSTITVEIWWNTEYTTVNPCVTSNESDLSDFSGQIEIPHFKHLQAKEACKSERLMPGAVLPDPVNPLHNIATKLKVAEVRERSKRLLSRLWSNVPAWRVLLCRCSKCTVLIFHPLLWVRQFYWLNSYRSAQVWQMEHGFSRKTVQLARICVHTDGPTVYWVHQCISRACINPIHKDFSINHSTSTSTNSLSCLSPFWDDSCDRHGRRSDHLLRPQSAGWSAFAPRLARSQFQSPWRSCLGWNQLWP